MTTFRYLAAAVALTVIGYVIPVSAQESVILSGQFAPVLSPDGMRIASCNTDVAARAVRIWDAVTGSELLSIPMPVPSCNLAWSSDGLQLIAVIGGGWANADAWVRIWDAASGAELLALRGDMTTRVWSIALSPDGTRIVTVNERSESIAKIWDMTTGSELFTLSGHSRDIRDIAWSPDGSHIVTGSLDKTAKIWDAQTGAELFTLTGHTLPVLGVAWSPDGSRVATIGQDGIARIWDATNAAEILSIEVTRDLALDVAWSPDGMRIVTAAPDAAKVWDAVNGAELLSLERTDDPLNQDVVLSVAWSSDGARILSSHTDEKVRVWDVAGISPAAIAPTAAQTEIEASPQTIAVEVEDGIIQLTLLIPDGWTARKALYGSAFIANVDNPLELVPNTLAAGVDQILGTIYRVRQGSPRSVTALLEQVGLDAESDIMDIIEQLPQLLAINRRYSLSAPESFQANGKPALRVAGTVQVGDVLLDAVVVVVDEGDGFSYFEFNTAAGFIASFLGHIDLIVGTVEVESGGSPQDSATSVSCIGLPNGDELTETTSMDVVGIGANNVSGAITIHYPTDWTTYIQSTTPNPSIVITDHVQGLQGLGSGPNPCFAGTLFYFTNTFLSEFASSFPPDFPVSVPENFPNAPLENVVPVMAIAIAPRTSSDQLDTLVTSLSAVEIMLVNDTEIGFQTGEFPDADGATYSILVAVVPIENGMALFGFQLPGDSYRDTALAIVGSIEIAIP